VPPALPSDNSTGLLDPFGLAGTLLEGQYRVDAVVGEGGFGIVYKGRHLSLDQPIAIKVLKGLDGGDAAINAVVLEKFRAEARLLYTLSQSSLHIVRALDFGAATTPSGIWAPFMILEWLDGRSLAADLAERRARGLRGRSVDEALAILEPVADGLSAAHRQQVAHRDIKPANVFLLGGSEGGPRVKILDFGIAKIMKEGEAVGTKGTFASFTWLYAAPEQLDPRIGATGLATDVYAFGLLLTELLTDRAPIEGRDVVGIVKTATDPNRRPTPRTLGANVPDEIEAVCLRALSVDPKSRYANVAELWSALVAARSTRAATAAQSVVPSVVVAPRSSALPPPAAAAAPSAAAASAAATPDAMAETSLAPGVAPRSDPMMAAPPARASAPVLPRPSAVPNPGPVSPQGGWPLSSQQSAMLSPPLGTRPPGTMSGPMAGYPASPPLGTLPPGHPAVRRPLQRSDGSTALVVVTTVLCVLAALFLGTCAAIYGACSAIMN